MSGVVEDIAETRAASATWGERARSLLYSDRAPAALALLAFAISLPSLGFGFQLDDRTYLQLFAQGRTPLDLLYEDARALAHARNIGVFSWWSGSEFSIHFLRIGSALSHWVDFTLWPDAPWAMHLTNCLLYALTVGVAALLYREVSPDNARLAGLAALMFAVNDSHAQSVGWIASRHIVLGTLFALLALLLHVRGRTRRSFWLQAASVLCTALALFSAELGAVALTGLVAYALVLEPGPVRTRLASIAPHALVGGAWLFVYAALGCGARGASWYRDPLHAPFATLFQGLADLPLWLLALLGGDVANAALVLTQSLSRVLAVVLFAPLLWLLLPPLAATKQARFFALASVLSCGVLFATVPQDRMLLVLSFPGFGWVASFLCSVNEHSSAVLRGSAAGLRFPHLVAAPLGFIPMLGGAIAVDGAAQALAEAVPSARTTQAIVVNLPVELLTNAAWSVRERSELPLHQLYAGFSTLVATRPDAQTLELANEDGWCTRPLERMFTPPDQLPKLSETRSVEGMQATVLELSSAGLPTRVRFRFPDALESPTRVWLAWDGRRPIRWRPPAVGGRAEVPSASRLTLLF